MRMIALSLVLAAGVHAGCSKPQSEASATAQTPAAASAQLAVGAAPAAGAPSAGSAMPALASSHGPAVQDPHAGMGAMAGMIGGQASKPTPVVQKMPPPEGGLSVADVWAKRAALAGKAVTVRGTVVKFNGGIMGRNWMHIQDGTGKADDNTHDLTITSDAVVKVGDVVTVTGILAVDKDFTAGYVYPVIVEGGKIK